MQEIKQRLKEEAQDIERECTLLANDHYFAAGRWDRINLMLGIPTTVLAGITSVAALSDIAGENKNIVTGVLAIIVAALSALTTFLSPSETANRHKSASSSYEALRMKANLLKDIDLSADYAGLDDSTKESIKQLKELATQFSGLSQSSLRVPRSIHKRNRRDIQGQDQA